MDFNLELKFYQSPLIQHIEIFENSIYMHSDVGIIDYNGSSYKT